MQVSKTKPPISGSYKMLGLTQHTGCSIDSGVESCLHSLDIAELSLRCSIGPNY